MPLDIITGAQWGDEGKGRVVDLFSEQADLVARYNGGDNAGHTVTVGEQIYKLHVIPSGIIHPQTISVLGSGMVINPSTFAEELRQFQCGGIEITPQRLWISDAAQLITPGHQLLDRAQEAALGKGQIGTTGRGIGPAYIDKAARRGIRAGEIEDEASFEEHVYHHFESVNDQLTDLYHQESVNIRQAVDEFLAAAFQLKPYIRRIGPGIQAALHSGKRVLAEGAQGTLLDLDQGTYPYVTSSCTTSSGIFSGLGIGIYPVRKVVGVTKAFQTRVGAGPFPTEQSGNTAEFLRGSGSNPWDEYGTTTGRPRRVGWLDLVLLQYAHEINGFTELFLTKLDVLSGLEQIQVCTSYTHGPRILKTLDFSGDARLLAECAPVYETLPGWQEDIRSIRSWDELPAAARDYVCFIEQFIGLPVANISVGPERNALIAR